MGWNCFQRCQLSLFERDGDDLVTSRIRAAAHLAHGDRWRPGRRTGASTYPVKRIDRRWRPFLRTCDGPRYKGADEVVVIGGGNSRSGRGLHLSEFARPGRVLARHEPDGLPDPAGTGQVRSAVHRSTPAWTSSRSRAKDEPLLRPWWHAIAKGGRQAEYPAAAAVFVFIGLETEQRLPRRRGGAARDAGKTSWSPARRWTCVPGVFAAGDVHSGSTKQLGSAVGDGITALLDGAAVPRSSTTTRHRPGLALDHERRHRGGRYVASGHERQTHGVLQEMRGQSGWGAGVRPPARHWAGPHEVIR